MGVFLEGLKKMFAGVPPDIREHNYTQDCWGHKVTLTSHSEKYERFNMSGWGYSVKVGDIIILTTKKGTTPIEKDIGKIARYKVIRVKYYNDPSDMFEGRVELIKEIR